MYRVITNLHANIKLCILYNTGEGVCIGRREREKQGGRLVQNNFFNINNKDISNNELERIIKNESLLHSKSLEVPEALDCWCRPQL